MKQCTGCGRSLPLECFHLDKAGAFGRKSRCRDCRKAERPKRRSEPPEAKRCRKCLQKRPAGCFHADDSRSDRLHPYCNDCRSNGQRRRYNALVESGQARCCTCGEIKLLGEFYRRKTDDGRYLSDCKVCARMRQAMRRFEKYGITTDDYDRMYAAQQGRCKICGDPRPLRGSRNDILHVDHDHATGRVRGLLCSRCNAMLGHARDNPQILHAAIGYIETT